MTFDWNGDGKIDGFDSFMDFMIFSEVIKAEQTEAENEEDHEA